MVQERQSEWRSWFPLGELRITASFRFVLLGNRGGKMTDSSKKNYKKVGKMESEDIRKGFT